MLGLGRLDEVPLRSVWEHEAIAFTPWLLENEDALGEVLGLDLELQRAEHAVGAYSLDLIGADRSSGEIVIVENQLETTDNPHLGQLLTYAGGTDAVNIVWIAAHFRAEHRAALDWLNLRTDVGTRFFGVEVSAVRIGESLPAPLFRVVVQPNDWGKQVRTRTQAQEGDASERALQYQEFWDQFLARVRGEHPSWSRATSPPRQNWFPMAVGLSGAAFKCSFTRRGLLSELYFEDPDPAVNESRFDQLLGRLDVMTEVYGPGLTFERLDGKKGCRIGEYVEGEIGDTESWPEFLSWFLDRQERLREALEAAGGVPNT